MKTESQKKQQQQLILLFVIILATVGVYLFSKKGGSAPDSETASPGAAASAIGKLNISSINSADFGILSSSSFKNLEKNGQYPIEIGIPGRDNPFLPYEEGIQ